MTAAESPTVSGRKYDRGQRMAGGGIAGVVLVALTPRKPPCRWGSGGSCAKNTSFSGKSYPVISAAHNFICFRDGGGGFGMSNETEINSGTELVQCTTKYGASTVRNTRTYGNFAMTIDVDCE